MTQSSDKSGQRRAVLRTALILTGVVLLIYFAFVARGVFNLGGLG